MDKYTIKTPKEQDDEIKAGLRKYFDALDEALENPVDSEVDRCILQIAIWIDKTACGKDLYNEVSAEYRSIDLSYDEANQVFTNAVLEI